MNRIVLRSRVDSDGSVHVTLPRGAEDAGAEVRVTVEPLTVAPRGDLLASDLLKSDLLGIWAGRSDIPDNHEFARRLREQAQSRRHDR